MKNILYWLLGLVIGGVVGWSIKTCPCPPPDHLLVPQKTWDSINKLASLPPLIIRDTVWKYGMRTRTDTIWVSTRDSTVQWWRDSLVNKSIRTWHSVAYSGKVYGSYWEFEPITKIIHDSIRIYVPQIVEIPKEVVTDKWRFYVGVYSCSRLGIFASAVRKDMLVGIGYSGDKYPFLMAGYRIPFK